MFISKKKLARMLDEAKREASDKAWNEIDQQRARERLDLRFDRIEQRLWALEKPQAYESKI